MEAIEMVKPGKPEWLKIKLPQGKSYFTVKEIVKKYNLHTICQSGNCPNIGDCWGSGTATFMILGEICTRSCRFCAVKTGKPDPVGRNEPENIAASVKLMNLKHCVITSVDRDDLKDGGSVIWSEVIKAIKKESPSTTIEALIPDFNGNPDSLNRVVEAHPEIISHNLETTRKLTGEVRSCATYKQSLNVLQQLKNSGTITKSGIMVGLGESDSDIYETMDDVLNVGCDIFTIGQYLQPTLNHLPVKKYVSPEEFIRFKEAGLKKGFKVIESAPLVRSSYHAEKHLFQK
ncbi:MAG: lipoyl synthase [Bacteroidia bacterium]|nr:lipoyl synthase [Bacteroidia bacterium]